MLLKPAEQLLADDVRSFAAGAELTGPSLRGAMQNAVSAGISELLESDGEEIGEDLAQTLEESKARKQAFVAAARALLEPGGPLSTPPPAGIGFDEYLRRSAPAVAQALAERLGVGAECKSRGIDGLLAIKSVRMWAGAAASLAWARFEGRAPRADDAGETLHAVTAAAAAETFVTGDAQPLAWLPRAAFAGLQITDLKGFLAATQPPSAD